MRMVRWLVELPGMALWTRVNRSNRRSANGFNVRCTTPGFRDPEVACLCQLFVGYMDDRPDRSLS